MFCFIHRTCSFFFILSVCILLVHSNRFVQAIEQPLIDENAQAMLKSVVDEFSKSERGKLQVQSEVVFSMRGMKDGYEKQYVLAWERPNKFAWRTSGETEGPNVISNGSKLFHYIESTSAYVESDAPESLAKLDLFPNDEDHIQGIRNPETIYHDFLLGENPWNVLTKDLKSITFERDDSNEEGVHTVRLEREDFAYTFWIKEGESPVFIKIRPEWNDFIAQGGITGAEGMSIENVIQFTDWKMGQDIEQTLFEFSPGADIRKAESIEDALTPPPPPAPDFTISLMDGSEFTLSDYKGKKFVVLDFWATWCPPCRAAMPVMEEIAEKYKDKNLIILAVNQQEPEAKVKDFLKQNNYHPKAALDNGRVGNMYQVSSLPTFVIIDKDGMIRDYIEGFDPEIEKRIQAVMN